MAEEGLQGFVVPPRPNTSPPVLRAPRARRPAEGGADAEETTPNDAVTPPLQQESEEDVKRHYQSYHDHYYGITPRDPRLPVPLKPIYPDPPAVSAPAANGQQQQQQTQAKAPVVVNASDIVDTAVNNNNSSNNYDDPQGESGSPLSLPGGGGIPHHPPSSIASANASATSFPSGAKTPESMNLLNESGQSARQQIANAGTSTMPPAKSPANRSMTRSPGHTHQPYATTPVTPNDMLPSGLLQSPAQLSLDAGRQQLQQSQQQQQQQGGQPQATLFGAPVMQMAPQQQQYQVLQPQQQPQPQQPPQQQPVQQQSQQQQWQPQQQQAGNRGGAGGGRSRGRGGGDINAAQQQNGGAAITVQKSALLQSFHDDQINRQGSNLSLLDLTNHIVEFASDQDGSRLIQRLMVDEATSNSVLTEVLPKAVDLMIDVFGNYVIQRLLETGNQAHRSALVAAMKGHVVRLSLQTYGCRVVQKALHYATEAEQEAISRELDGSVADCVRDQNGNHVVQKCIEMMPTGCAWLADSFVGNLPGLASHAYGCRVMQRLFERCPNTHPSIEKVVTETLKHTDSLVNDQYGNYVIQHILINGTHDWRSRVHLQLKDRFGNLSCSKFSSNATEKLFVHVDDKQRAELVDIVTKLDGNGTCPFVFMMQDQFANYVVQKVIDLSNPEQREQIINAVKPSLEQIRKYTYGKHIISRFEKMGLLPPGSSGPMEPNERQHHGGGSGGGYGGGGGGGRGRGGGRGGRGRGRGGDDGHFNNNNQYNNQPQQQQYFGQQQPQYHQQQQAYPPQQMLQAAAPPGGQPPQQFYQQIQYQQGPPPPQQQPPQQQGQPIQYIQQITTTTTHTGPPPPQQGGGGAPMQYQPQPVAAGPAPVPPQPVQFHQAPMPAGSVQYSQQ